MSTLYVTEPGARLEREYERLIVTCEDEVIFAAPFARVSHVVLVGRVGMTTPAMLSLLDAGIGCSLITHSGILRGHLTPPSSKNIPLRLQQYRRTTEPEFCLHLARQFAAGRLRNSRTLARRISRRHAVPPNPFDTMTAALHDLDHSSDLAAVRSREGRGTRAYFSILRRGLEPGLRFGPRTRRPPRDEVNALLSLGYSLLTQTVISACEIAGLDPYAGFYHAHKYGRPALALDLMEEWRSVIVDSLVLNLVNRNRINEDEFIIRADGAPYLTLPALRKYISAYTKRLLTTVRYPDAQRPLSYQKLMEVQARRLRQVIEGTRLGYTPYKTR